MQTLVLTVALLLIGCDEAKSPRTTTTQRSPFPATTELHWDLTVSREAGKVGWPNGLTDDLWFIEEPTKLDLVMPSGEHRVIEFRSAQIRLDDQRRVRNCNFFFEPERLEDAYSRAKDLCEQFGIDGGQELSKWRDKRISEGENVAVQEWLRISRPDGDPQPCFVEIRYALNPKTPWQVRLCFDFENLNPIAKPKG